MPRNKRFYILYDSRACGGQGTDKASVCEAGVSLDEHEYDGSYGAVACYSYRQDGKHLVDEKWEWDWFPEDHEP